MGRPAERSRRAEEHGLAWLMPRSKRRNHPLSRHAPAAQMISPRLQRVMKAPRATSARAVSFVPDVDDGHISMTRGVYCRRPRQDPRHLRRQPPPWPLRRCKKFMSRAAVLIAPVRAPPRVGRYYRHFPGSTIMNMVTFLRRILSQHAPERGYQRRSGAGSSAVRRARVGGQDGGLSAV